MKRKIRSRGKRSTTRSVLRLPDLEHAKAAVLNSPTCPDAQRGYRHAIDEFVDWYCSEPRLALNKTVVLRYRSHLESRQLAPGTKDDRLLATDRGVWLPAMVRFNIGNSGPQVFKVSYNWDLPFGHGKPLLGAARGVLNQFVGNWKVGGLSVIQNGIPFQVRLGATAGWPDDAGAVRPNFVLRVPLVLDGWRQRLNDPTNPNAAYLNAAAFSAPARFTIGNVPRVTNIYSPNTFKFDMTLQKEFPIHEQVKHVFRGEFYGALNHASVQANSNYFQVFQNLDYTNHVTPPITGSTIVSGFTNMTLNMIGTRTIQLGLKLYFCCNFWGEVRVGWASRKLKAPQDNGRDGGPLS